MHELINAIKGRRTVKPATYSNRKPDASLILKLIDIARHAPNHHRTEPARFYLLNQSRIKELGQLFGEIISDDGTDPQLVERGKKKSLEWGNAPGLLIVTCFTDKTSDLVKKKPAVIDEDYATCCCICQNLLLLFQQEGISSKWSTGPVWEHKDFAETIGLTSPKNERVVALLFYGYSQHSSVARTLSPLSTQLKNYLET